ncbi:MAG: hypothetical protein JWM33_722, partial [Caulobacteraceae bacterium]|nr:hypothetical protein [Caulobacteraceae bacterium]
LWVRLSRRLNNDAARARDEMAARGLTRPPASGAAKSAAPEILRPPSRFDLPGDVVGSAPLLYSPTLLVARRLAVGLALPATLGNPVAERATMLAGEANMLIRRLPDSESNFALVASAFSPSEADQQACLDRVLTELDAGHTGLGLAPNIDAWARGDYLSGLLRMNVLNTCPYGQVGDAYWSALITQALDALERARAAGGVTVAVLEFDPLLAKGGILDRLAQAGWTVTPPEEMQ